MTRGRIVILMIVVLAGGFRAGVARQAESTPTRFATLEVRLDSGDVALAAWQLAVAAVPDETVRIVGIEGGEHEAFADPPFYDERAMMRDRVVIAGFSTASEERLPRGSTRVATIHLQIVGDGEPEFDHEIQVAATVGGERIDVDLDLRKGSER